MNEDTKETIDIEDDDLCIRFLSNFVLKTMRMKYDKWAKMMSTDEFRVCTHHVFF